MSSPSFTIVCIEGRLDYRKAVEAIQRTANCLPYACRKLLISPSPPHLWCLDWIQIPDIGPKRPEIERQINLFYLDLLPRSVETDFIITVQADGYATHPENWTDEFLKYDYLAPPWPIWTSLATFTLRRFSWPTRIGSGGFTLQSRKHLEGCLSAPKYDDLGSDVYLMYYRRHWLDLGCRIAPIKLCLKWGIEWHTEDHPFWNPNHSFGFHGLDRGKPIHSRSYFRSFPVSFKNSKLYKEILCRNGKSFYWG